MTALLAESKADAEAKITINVSGEFAEARLVRPSFIGAAIQPSVEEQAEVNVVEPNVAAKPSEVEAPRLWLRPLTGKAVVPTSETEPKPKGKVDLVQLMKGRKINKRVEVEEAEETEAVDELVEERIEASAVEAPTGKALVPVRRFASQILLPDVGEAEQVVQLINLKHQIVGNYGCRCMVISWERWPINPRFLVPTFQKVADFKNRYANRFVEKETKTGIARVPVGTFWFSHPASATFDGVAFRPDTEDQVRPGRLLNLWRGFAVEPKKGSWRLIRRHIYTVLGNGDWKAGRYILRWYAHMFQNLGKPGQTILVFQGEEGVGKGIMAEALMQILGPYSLPVSQPRHLLGAFSGHLQHCVFLFLDEAFWAGDQKAEGRLKSLVTEKRITIEPKYVTPFQTPNLLHMMMASNSDWVVPAGRTARRYAVFKVSNKYRRNKAYFAALRD